MCLCLCEEQFVSCFFGVGSRAGAERKEERKWLHE